MTLQIIPKTVHEYSLIFLHGFSSSGNDYSCLKKFCKKFPTVKIICPNAPFMETWYDTSKCSSWYFFQVDEDRWQQDLPEKESLISSQKYISGIIKQECDLVGENNVFLGGSSQGCGMAFHCYASSEFQLGGFLGIRGMILEETSITHKLNGSAIFHYGDQDDVIEPNQTCESVFRLKGYMNYSLKKHKGVDHDFGDIEIKCILNFLKKMIKNPNHR